MENMTDLQRSTFVIPLIPGLLAPISAWREGTAVPTCSTPGLGGDHGKRAYRGRTMSRPRLDSAPGS